MRVHSEEKLVEMKRLRKQGYSINELVRFFSIPKSTVWHHIHAIRISPKHRAMWKSKQGGSTKRSEKKWLMARERARELISGSSRESAIALALLHWTEGSKRTPEFINSDGEMIKIYLALLRSLLGVSQTDIKPTLRIFTGMNKNQCLIYWSKILRIPMENFVVRLNDGSTSGRTKYGMCRITVIKGGDVLKLIRSLIEQLPGEIPRESPRSSAD